MISYTMVGTNDFNRALKFYEQVMADLGMDVCWKGDGAIAYGKKDDLKVPNFIVGKPFDGEPATVGNGTMTSFWCNDPAHVDKLYRTAIDHGGQSEGEPGYRPQYMEGFYAAYVRDLDGNKLAFVNLS
ncbi:VOC family protein [Pseudidiomarina sediminum]|uniref:VOC family protein n=1 Tax=Pseudidiomarina sediminum TaxID=431675 RepID=A0A432YZE8_9GAMM|nr:VOC family protein [Pseudidiomarina sediminum]MBY6064994.1 VOC family protein [Pseudidiomarina sediminum]RUO68994.1 VOC family protein [Pseudidiomarina sediminum]